VIRSTNPIDRGEDQRFWRSRANRRVRKARLTRNALRWSALLLAHLVIATIVLGAGVRVFRQATSSEEFALERIEIHGVRRASTAAIQQRVGRYVGHNLLDLNMGEIAALAALDPWARSASAKRLLPDTLRVTIEERRPCALAMLRSGAHLIDTSGYVISPSGPGLTDDLPVLTGIADLEGAELIEALRRGTRMLLRVQDAVGPWIAEISELDLRNPREVALRTIGPGPTILLDPARVERNLSEYLALRRDIGNRVGPVAFVDLRWQDRIAVTPVKNSRYKKEAG